MYTHSLSPPSKQLCQEFRRYGENGDTHFKKSPRPPEGTITKSVGQTTKYLLRLFQLSSTGLRVTGEREETEASKTFLVLKGSNVICWKELSATLLFHL